jgi:hypothetical protein
LLCRILIPFIDHALFSRRRLSGVIAAFYCEGIAGADVGCIIYGPGAPFHHMP